MPDTGTRPRLVLEVPPEAVSRLKRSALLRATAADAGQSASSRTIYYDTPDFSLRERAVAVVLSDGRATAASAMEPADLAALATVPDTPLRPIFEASLARTVRRLVVGDATLRIELAIGRLASAKGATPFAQVALDLEAGEPEQLVATALDLRRSVRARLTVDSEIDRGYALAAGVDPAAIRIARAQPVALDPALSVEQGLARLLRGCLEHWIGNEAAVLDHRAAEAVHQMRVALRRLRAVLTQFRPMLPEADDRMFGSELRWLGQRLGEARDWDVMLDDTLPPVEAAFAGEPALQALRRAVEAVRSESYDRLLLDLNSERYARLVYGFAAWTFGFGWRHQPLSPPAAALFQPLAPYAATEMARRRRKLFQGVAAPSGLPCDVQHALRKRVKRARYLIEFFAPLLPGKPPRRLSRLLAEAQEALGRANDLSTARRLLDQMGVASDPLSARGGGLVLGWHAGTDHASVSQIDRCWSKARSVALAA